MVCPVCGNAVGSVVITKGNKAVGINFFCKSQNCHWEHDARLKKKVN